MNAEPVHNRSITQNTLIPVGVAFGLIVVLVGGILWLTEIRTIAAQNSQNIIKIDKTLDQLNRENFELKKRLFDGISSQDERLSRIEGKLEIIYDIIKPNGRHQ